MRTLALIVPLLFVMAPALHAECSARSGTEHPRLVELYTSEGCSSCPPAEAWMRSIRDDARLVGLEFHVDYWDELGWPDRFADARYSARQRELAQREAHAGVYTPEVLIDGQVWTKWPALPAPNGAASESPALNLGVVQGATIDVDLDGGVAESRRYRMFVALTENGLASTVSAGENRGRRLAHDQVVRDLAGPFAPPRAKATLAPPADFAAANGAVVAFIEDTTNGQIAQVVRLALAGCPRTASEKP